MIEIIVDAGIPSFSLVAVSGAHQVVEGGKPLPQPIVVRAGALFSVWYTYDAGGTPRWFVMPGGDWTDGLTYAGDMYRTMGSPVTRDGYDPVALRLSAPGSYALRFGGDSTATLTYSIDGHAATQFLTRESPF